jgi:uncharacterized protein YdeI (YjbR/CyaY-like superfamily)
MVSGNTFRKLALSFPSAYEEPHFEKASFRVNKKIFATMPPDGKLAVLMLPIIEQSVFCAIDQSIIYPVPGTWGKNGATIFELTGLKADLVKDALSKAYCKVALKSLASGLSENKDPVDIVPTFFANQHDFRKWLAMHHDTKGELLVGFYKVGCGKPSITWPQSVDEALCFGWIDGVRRNIDKDSYSIRFTPRKAKSIWSTININKVAELVKNGLMQPAGLAAYSKREESKSSIYSYEKQPVVLDAGYEGQLMANEAAWAYLQKQPASYRNAVIDWVMSAKQEPTRLKRLHELITDCAEGRKIKRLSY